ncbi:protein kinase [Polymorphospora sp. NPDC050346]|uniref:protein kinase domain-containing protein n=1 Tax=Polymorphospora sp. NPDC050346 TaxID=3155780 RepID=UPI00340B9BBD
MPEGATTTFFVGPPEEPDKYRLLRQVGGGGEAELWQADVALGAERERVAVKVLRSAHEDRATWRSRWIEQADLLRLIRHPGVVGVHAAFEGPRMHHVGAADPAETALYLVMNWVDGTDLRDWPARQSGPPAAVFTCLTQLADVLDWLHSGRATPSGRPVVHGDISPANVIVNADGQAVLVDFGLFRMSNHNTSLPAGTQGYIAPEVLRDGSYSPASDRYGFGGLAYFLLTGTHPPATADARAAGLHAVFGPTPSLDHALLMFADDPAARPAAGEWVRNLRSQASTTTMTPTGLPPMRPGPASPSAANGGPSASGGASGTGRSVRPWWLVAAGAALTLVLVAGVLGAVELLGGGDGDGERTTTGDTAGDVTGTPPTAGESPRPDPSGTPAASDSQVYLVSLKPRDKPNMEEENGVATIDDREYPSSISRSCFGVSLEYHLGYDYTRFQSTVGLDDESDSGSSATFVVYVDDKRQDSATVRLAETGTVEADVTGAFRLRIEAEIAGGYNCGVTTVFADPTLTR